MKNRCIQLLLIIGLLAFGRFLKAAEHCHSCQSVIFKENKKQWHSNVQYKAEIKGGELLAEKNGFSFMLYNQEDMQRMAAIHHGKYTVNPDKPSDYTLRYHVIKTNFVNANTATTITAQEKVNEYFNYFLGDDATKWASGVQGFKKIIYKNIYNGIDVAVYSEDGLPKYDYIIAPEANIADIQYQIVGAVKLYLKEEQLIIETSVGELKELKPFAYQLISGSKVEVPCKFKLKDNIITFDLPKGYDKTKRLIIDPTLIFSTYSGSFADNFGYTATYDSRGNAFAAGSVFHYSNWVYPTTAGAFQTTWAGGVGYGNPNNPSGTGTDMAITKYDSAGLNRVYSTYLGGNRDDLPHSMVVNSADELILFGTTASSNYPTTTNAFDRTYAGGPNPGMFSGIAVNYNTGSDIVVTRFNFGGTALLGSTYIGGTGNDGLNYPTSQFLNYNYADEVRGEVDVDENDNIIVATCTNSTDFPVTANGYQTSYGGGQMDAVLFKMNGTLSTMIWGTYLGGSLDDAAYSIAFDKNGDVIAAGGTRSTNFPVSAGAYQSSFSGGRCDGFIAKLSPNAQQLLNSTYYGGVTYDQNYFVETNKMNEIYVFGQTDATDSIFIFNSTFNVPLSGQYVTKFDPNLRSRLWSNVFGRGLSRPDISPTAFLVDLCNKVYMSGWGSDFSSFGGVALGTTGLPVSSNAFQTTTDGNDFYLMVMEDGGTLLNYATYFGSPSAEEHVDGGTSRFDKKGVCYQSVCAGCGGVSTFPTFPSNTVSTINNSYNCNNAIFKFDFDLPFIKADFKMPTTACLPVTITLQDFSKTFATTTYYWDFGNGQTSSLATPTVTYTQPGQYTVRLVVVDTQSCNLRDTLERQILVLSSNRDTLPEKIICLNGNIQIGLPPISDPNVTFSWSPVIGLSDTNVSNPIATPRITTNYQLIVNNGICLDTFYQKVIVFETNFLPIGDTVFCPNDTLHLSVTNSNNLSGISYLWQPSALIYGSVTNQQIAAHSPQDTLFKVMILGGPGCSYSLIIPANIVQDTILKANFSIPPTACAPGSVSFVNNSTVFPTTTYSWTFGDGGSSTLKNPSHTYTQGGVYTIRLIIRDVLNCNQLDSVTKQISILDTKKDSLPTKVLCLGESRQIGITPYPTTVITYNWIPTNYLSNAAIANPVSTPQHSTNYILLVNNGICTDTFTQRVLVFNDELKLFHDSFPCPQDTIHLFVQNNLPNQTINYNWAPMPLILSGQGTSMATALPNTDTVFYVIMTNAAGCLFIDSTDVTVVRNKVVKADFVQPLSGCFPHSVNFQNNSTIVANPQYQWTFGDGGSSTLQNPVHTYTAPGVYTIRLIVSDAAAFCHPADTITKQLSVLTNFAHYTLPTDSICVGSSTNLGNAIIGIDTSFTLTWSPNYYLSATTILNPIATPPIDTLYELKVEKNGCTFYYDKRVEILQDTIRLFSDTAVCPGDTLRLLVSNTITALPLQYHWSPLSLIVADSLTKHPLVTTFVDTVFTVSGTNAYGCSYSKNIKVHALTEKVIKADFTPPNSGCAPYLASFLSSGNVLPTTTFEWHFGDGAVAFTKNPTHQYSGGVYYVTLIVRDNQSCNLVDSITKRIIILDSKKDTLPAKLVCAGQSVKIGIDSIANTNLTYQWIPATYLNNATIANPVATPLQSMQYILIVNNGICRDTFSQSVIQFSAAFTLSQDSIVCPQNVFHVTATNLSGQTNLSYDWQPTKYIISGGNTTTATVQVPRDTFIFIAISNGVCFYYDSVAVQVLDEEVARADFNAPLFGCAPFTAQFLSSSYVKFAPKYTWDFGDGSALSTVNNPIHTYNTIGTYTVTLYLFDSTFLCKQRDTIQKVISIQNNYAVDTLPTLLRCKNSQVQVGISPAANTTYIWEPNYKLTDSTIANPFASPDTNTWYKLTVNASNCVRYYYQLVEVVDDSLWITKADPTCSSGIVDLFANTKNNHANWQFSWSPFAAIQSGQNTDHAVLQPVQNILVSLIATDDFGCVYTDTVYAAISAAIGNIDVVANPTTIRYMDTSQLNILNIDPDLSYYWESSPTLSNPAIKNPKAFPLQTTTYYAYVTDTFGCYKRDSVTVNVYRTPCPDAVYFVPNAFTPNGDGKNDLLYVRGHNILSVHFIVFDRWGQRVFETNDINKGWDGTYNGAKLDPAVFAYIVEGVCVGGEHYTKKGNVTILR